MSYAAFITRVYTRPFPNADRLLLGNCMGSQVIVGKDTENGQLGVFFPEGGQLSERMALENNLLKEQGGYLDSNRRIRALKLRGEKSEGLWLPLTALDWTGGRFTQLEGEQITAINNIEICCRYETPAQKRQKAHQQRQGKVIRGETRFFRKVGETPQLRHVLQSIPEDALIYVTEKLHGTSGRYGRALEPTTLPWWKRWLGMKPSNAYVYLNGSRNVILEHRKEDTTSFYGSDQFRFDAVAGLELHKGETLYFELVGWARAGTPIMPAHPIDQKDRGLRQSYGPTMRYSYGCSDGTCRLFVYRITQTNEDGVVLELSWTQMRERCQQLGLETVPCVLWGPYVDAENLEELLKSCVEGPSELDDSHIREGVVLRIESAEGIKFAKEKSFTFKVLEGIIREDEAYVDTEEVA